MSKILKYLILLTVLLTILILNLAQAVLLKNANTEVLFTDEEIQDATKTTEIPVE